jgi:hypothetical protein
MASPIADTTETNHQKPSAPSAPYERLKGEGAKAYEAFSTYRDLPIAERSLTAVSQRLGKNRSLCARWSSQFQWRDRATAWDDHQDHIRRARRAAEREKMYDRQLQGCQLMSQALMRPAYALTKRTQANPDAFAETSAAELAKLVSFNARALPGIYKEERALLGTPQQSATPENPLTIAGAEFTWVQSRCTCGHVWNVHDQSVSEDSGRPMPMTCTVQNCGCTGFVDADES